MELFTNKLFNQICLVIKNINVKDINEYKEYIRKKILLKNEKIENIQILISDSHMINKDLDIIISATKDVLGYSVDCWVYTDKICNK